MRPNALSLRFAALTKAMRAAGLAAALATVAVFGFAAPAGANADDSADDSRPNLALLRPKLAEMRPDENRTLWLIIENTGKREDRLVSVSSPQFSRAKLVTPHSDADDGLRIPAGEARTLGPRGDAVVLLGAPAAPWLEGQSATLELAFERSGPITLALRAGPRPSGGLQITTADHTLPSAKEGTGEPGELLRAPKPGKGE